MEIGRRIREHRTGLGLSQDELAGRVYVSRQTISSWENNKTYPDVQSLLILSEVFGTTIDDLIKGDVETMAKTVEHDVTLMNRLSWVMVGFTALMFACLLWASAQIGPWGWSLAQAAPTFVLALVLWGIAFFASVWVERIKKEHDIVTYREILAFSKGEAVDRETPEGRRARRNKSKLVRIIGLLLVGAAVGALIGWLGAALVDVLLGA